MRIGTDFPGGNVAVRSLEEKRALLSPELRDTEGYWFYWCFEAGFDVPGDYEFEFDGIAVGACGPAVSEDGGRSWRWLGSGGCTDYRFVYRAERPGRVRFSSGMQYLQSDLERFLSEVPEVTRSVLCRSRKGREVELLRLGAADAARKVLLTSRHHCCEAMATHVLEGMLRAAAAPPELLKNTAFYAVPFVDKDGAEEGDQGKNRLPRDHAQDYCRGASLYPETEALVRLVRAERPCIVLDLHCPWLKFEPNERLHFVGPESKRMERAMDAWAVRLERELPPGLPYSASDNIRFGTGWNTAENYAKGRMLSCCCGGFDFVRVALALEIPYANMRGCVLDAAKARELGSVLLRVAAAALQE